jgi:hypothetical protein
MPGALVKQGIRPDLKDFRVRGIPDCSRLFPTLLWSGFGQISIHAGGALEMPTTQWVPQCDSFIFLKRIRLYSLQGRRRHK